MKNLFESIANGLLYAWKKEMNIPLPGKLRERAVEYGDWGCAGFPLLGWLIGLVITLAGVIVQAVFNIYAGALVFAVLTWLLFLYRDSGQCDGAFSAFLTGKLPGDNVRNMMPVFLMIVRMAMLVLLFIHGKMWHLPMIIAGVFMLEALLTMNGTFMPPLLDDSPESRRNMWVTAVILAFISFAMCPLATALGIALFMVIWRISQGRSEHEGSDLHQITIAGGAAGWALLLAGVLAI